MDWVGSAQSLVAGSLTQEFAGIGVRIDSPVLEGGENGSRDRLQDGLWAQEVYVVSHLHFAMPQRGNCLPRVFCSTLDTSVWLCSLQGEVKDDTIPRALSDNVLIGGFLKGLRSPRQN